MIPFFPFPKIAERVCDWDCDLRATRELDKLTWVATEKVHGANLCVASDGRDIAVGSRKGWLGPDAAFFDHRGAVGPLLPAFRRLFAQLSATRPARSHWVYGELYGGTYPHGEVAAAEDVHPVQTGVAYCPDVRFAAFDIAWIDDEGGRHFLPYRDAERQLVAVGVAVVPRLGVGTLQELSELPVAFASRVPAMLGMPVVEDNLAEGLVIRPWDGAPVLHNKYERPVLKRKHPSFAETRRYHGAQPWAVETPINALARVEAAAMSMLTRERANSARSKIGDDDVATVAEVVRDVQESLEEEHGSLLLAIAPDEHPLLWSVVHDAAAVLVRDAGTAEAVLDPERYHVALVLAFIRGRLGIHGPPHELVHQARAAKLRLHKFKVKSGPPRVTRILAELRGMAPSTLLDIGSGRGAFLWPLLAAFPEPHVHAVDVLEHRVRDIEAVREGGIGRVAGSVADVCALPFDDGSFDVVTILEVLEHLDNPAAAASEVLRVARRCIMVSVPSHEDDNPEHVRLFTRDSLTTLFRDAGASSVRIAFVRNHMIGWVTP